MGQRFYTMLSTISLLGLSLILCYQVNHGLAKQDGICRPFNKSSGLAELCGYNSTAKFVDMSDASSYARYYGRHLGNCTKTIRQVLCSNRFPRCEPDVKGPFLPCKRVLLDTLSKCGEEMRKLFIEEYTWLKWLVNLLPENNDPTTSNFKKRCFEPANFKTDVREGDLEPNKCFPLVVSPCQNYYKFTIFPEKEQKHRAYLMINNATTECNKMASKLICYDFLPPCYKGSKYVRTACKKLCQEYFKKDCSSPALSLFTKDKCVLYPMGNSQSQDYNCEHTEWLYATEWPGALENGSSTQQKASNLLIGSTILTSFAAMLHITL